MMASLGFLFLSVSAQEFEIGLLGGATNYSGDIGRDPSNESSFLRDIQYQLTKPAYGVYFRSQRSMIKSVRLSIIYGEISAYDKISRYPAIRVRNLNFKSPILEYSFVIERILKGKIKPHAYINKKGIPVREIYQYYFYGYAGIGMYTFDPHADYNGGWYELRPLGTEGQGLCDPYSDICKTDHYYLTQFNIPMGLGFKYYLTDRLIITGEIGWRKTFTDYLDDVSGYYADPDHIANDYGATAGLLSNRSVEVTQDPVQLERYQPGMQRGDNRSTDTYFFTLVKIGYIVDYVW